MNVRYLVLTTFALLIIAAVHHTAIAQDKANQTGPIDPGLTAKEDSALDSQAKALLDLVDTTLAQHPPQFPDPPQRKLALYALDAVLHDVYAPRRDPVQAFFQRRMLRAVDELESSIVEDGVRIWKLYNHAFVLRSAGATVAFDLTRARFPDAPEFGLSDELVARIVTQCDVLFVSHKHLDHADEWVAKTFLAQGKPVVAPPEVWTDRPFYAQLTHLERNAKLRHTLPIAAGQTNLHVVMYPGHQGPTIQNNVPLVFTPEGFSFAHFGDQRDGGSDFEWIDNVRARYAVDILLPNSWTTNIARAVTGFNPQLVITGHENELGHTIDHREPYWITYERKQGSDYRGGSKLVGYDNPLLVMTWGETYHYLRRQPAQLMHEKSDF